MGSYLASSVYRGGFSRPAKSKGRQWLTSTQRSEVQRLRYEGEDDEVLARIYNVPTYVIRRYPAWDGKL